MSDDPAFVSDPPIRTANHAPLPIFREIHHAAPPRVPADVAPMQDIELTVSLELGRADMTLRDVLALGQGTVVELNKQVGDPVDVVVNGQVVARGEVVVVEDRFAVRVTEVLLP